MKTCAVCQTQNADEAAHCVACGEASWSGAAPTAAPSEQSPAPKKPSGKSKKAGA